MGEKMNTPRLLKIIYYTLIVSTLVGAVASADNGAYTLSTSLCGIVGSIQTVIGVIAILLFITGGALYAGAHMLPAAGNLRGNLQGWSMGMIVGAVVGIILVILAPTLIKTIGSTAGSTVTSCS